MNRPLITPDAGTMDNDDGWTHVTKKSKQYGKVSSSSPAQPAAVERGLTLEKIISHFDGKLLAWRQRKNSARTELYQILDRFRPEGGWTIARAVCLGYGSFTRDDSHGRHRAATQVAMFLDVVQYLEKQQNNKIELYAQELKYTNLDKAFLTSKGFTVLEAPFEYYKHAGPAADQMGPNTFVCELYLDHNLDTISAILDRGNQLMITTARLHLDQRPLGGDPLKMTTLRDRDGGVATAEERQSLKDTFDENYRMYQFPNYEADPNAMGGLRICGLAPTEDD